MSGVFTIDPRGMTAREWTAASTINLERFGSIPILQKDESWREWAAVLAVFASLSGIVIPNPYDFAAFEEWAQRFNETLSGRA